MFYSKKDNMIFVRLERGEEIISSIAGLAEREKIESASVSGIGATGCVTIGVFDTRTKDYIKRTIHEPAEITCLCGNVTRKDGDPYLHIHITIGTTDGTVYGGHLNEGVISLTAEIVLTVSDMPIGRFFSEEVGLNLLSLDQEI